MNPETIHIPGHKKHTQIPCSIIAYLEAETNLGASYSYLHYINFNKSELIAATLKYFERLLPDFIRVSKHVLVNPAVIEQVVIERSRKASIILTNGRCFSIPRRRIITVQQQVITYLECAEMQVA